MDTKKATKQRRLVAIRAAAEYLGLSYSALYGRVKRGEIPALQLGPRLVRLDLNELDAWLLTRRIQPTESGMANG